MNANEVIESYITDVAVHLPRKQRNDVAFELRALLNEELDAKAKAHPGGRGADESMATELVRAFGRPAEVAARYRPTLTVIDPADGHRFVRIAAIGVAVIWCLGLVAAFRRPIGSGWDVLTAFGQWWTGTAIPSMWWPGVLVVWFGAESWARRRRPRGSEWTPRSGDRITGGPAAMVMGLLGVLAGLTVLLEPRWILDVVWGGRAAPAAYEALTYTDAFRHRQGPWVLVLIALNIPLFVAVIVNGRWSPMLRRLETVLALVMCVMLTWTVLDGPIFLTQNADRTTKFLLVLIVVFTLVYCGITLRRSVRPAPSAPVQASR